MTYDEREVLNDLRERGYAVVVFYPSETNGIDTSRLESRLSGLGGEVIKDLFMEKNMTNQQPISTRGPSKPSPC